MRGFFIVILSLTIVAATLVAAFDMDYWLLPPKQKFAHSWRADLALLEKTKHFPEAWKNLKEIEFTSNESFVDEWYKFTHSPIALHKNGKFKLQVLAVHQIYENRYGVLLQYNWIDLATGNTVGEIGRTLKLGIVY
ncbi:MAG: hypothetical protein NDI61_03405 [Bdellovibrionaceae bacterium]|nr:hypothetical protein [Pseudobdellovibrionaceae bacterium]